MSSYITIRRVKLILQEVEVGLKLKLKLKLLAPLPWFSSCEMTKTFPHENLTGLNFHAL